VIHTKVILTIYGIAIKRILNYSLNVFPYVIIPHMGLAGIQFIN